MGLSMRQQSAVAATVIGLTGIGLGLAAGFAVVYWLGVVAGIASVLAAYLAYLFVNRIVVTEEQTQALAAVDVEADIVQGGHRLIFIAAEKT